MNEFFPLLLTSLWLGILTSISPCPLASNIAAISFVSYRISNKKIVLLSSFFYIIGRSITYIFISFLVVKIAISVPSFSMFLQIYMNKILSFLLIFVGLVLLDIIKIPGISFNFSGNLSEKIDKFGIFGSLFCGILFAFSFCPVSAALFFGSLIPISISSKSFFSLPFLYGIGTALPIFIFAILIFFSMSIVNKFYKSLAKIEVYARKITGLIFLLVGIYYALAHIFKII